MLGLDRLAPARCRSVQVRAGQLSQSLMILELDALAVGRSEFALSLATRRLSDLAHVAQPRTKDDFRCHS